MLLSILLSQPLIFIPLAAALLIALTVHEFSHALAASLLGDDTAKDQGRLTLNPIAHLDFMGTLLLLLVGFGWGKPVPVNYYNLNNRRWGPALVSVAGPLSNLISVIIFAIAFKLIAPAYLNPVDIVNILNFSGNLLLLFLSFLVIYNLVLMIFNLIPIPPLDGSKLLFAILPPEYNEWKIYLQRHGPMILLMVLIFDSAFNLGIIGVLFDLVMKAFNFFYYLV